MVVGSEAVSAKSCSFWRTLVRIRYVLLRTLYIFCIFSWPLGTGSSLRSAARPLKDLLIGLMHLHRGLEWTRFLMASRCSRETVLMSKMPSSFVSSRVGFIRVAVLGLRSVLTIVIGLRRLPPGLSNTTTGIYLKNAFSDELEPVIRSYTTFSTKLSRTKRNLYKYITKGLFTDD